MNQAEMITRWDEHIGYEFSTRDTSVRLEVEQNQLVAGLGWIGIGETWLEGS